MTLASVRNDLRDKAALADRHLQAVIMYGNEPDKAYFNGKREAFLEAVRLLEAESEFRLPGTVDEAAAKAIDWQDTKGRWWRSIPYNGWHPEDDE